MVERNDLVDDFEQLGENRALVVAVAAAGQEAPRGADIALVRLGPRDDLGVTVSVAHRLTDSGGRERHYCAGEALSVAFQARNGYSAKLWAFQGDFVVLRKPLLQLGLAPAATFSFFLLAAGAYAPASGEETHGSKVVIDQENRICPPHNGKPRNRSTAREATRQERRAIIERMQRNPIEKIMAGWFEISMSHAKQARTHWTHVRHENELGTQITYADAGGQISLWMSGVPFIRHYHWLACEDRYETSVGKERVAITYGSLCFNYGRLFLDKTTGKETEEWMCAAAASLDAITVGREKGDVFGLANKTAAPFILSQDKVSWPELKAKLPSQ